MFQFPPNGKVLCKMAFAEIAHLLANTVSIPSERESALQDWIEKHRTATSMGFQFPPNGKVLCKTQSRCNLRIRDECFNSLRTGKCFARIRTWSQLSPNTSFHSLRTGKCFARDPEEEEGEDATPTVSIPSERESALQV